MSIIPSSLAEEIAGGDALRLLDISRRFALHTSTIFRWMQRGLPDGRGTRIKLEALRRGKTWLTSEAAVKRFFSALPASTTAPIAPVRSPSKRERDSARAEKALHDQYGI